MELEDLKKSEKKLGQIYPVIKDAKGNILDGFHRKRVDPNWKEITLPIEDELDCLRVRIHANIMRRNIPFKEKHRWVVTAQQILRNKGLKGSVREIAKALELPPTTVQDWLTGYQDKNKVFEFEQFYGYNVWGFKDESWRSMVVSGEPNQPDKEFYHGSTPAFVIHQLIKIFNPQKVLDSMAGVGTTGYVCQQYNVECDQFDIYPYPKFGVEFGDAETIDNGKRYDLIFNHIPYLDMVQYGEHEQDLSNMNEKDFFEKMKRIFLRNYELLEENGIYAILVGDWRFGKRLIPITAKITVLAHECGFVLQDEAIKLSAEQKGDRLQRYRAAQFGYLAQTFDMVLMFKKH